MVLSQKCSPRCNLHSVRCLVLHLVPSFPRYALLSVQRPGEWQPTTSRWFLVSQQTRLIKTSSVCPIMSLPVRREQNRYGTIGSRALHLLIEQVYFSATLNASRKG